MIPNKPYIVELMKKNNWSQNKLALKAGVSKTTVSRWINGKRGAGRELMSGFIRAFPSESIDKLFFLEVKLPNGDNIYKERGSTNE